LKISLIDAGPLIALFDGNDTYHQRVLSFLKGYTGQLLTSWAVLTEVCYMLDFHKQVRSDFLNWILRGGLEVVNLKPEQLEGIDEKMLTYSDLPADFADATLMEIAEERNIQYILSLDRDFDIYRLKKGRMLVNLLGEE
jgi:predicted nucleic acid-binding protein